MAEERVERRLTAILAADVAGYSRLMAADEEGTLAALKTLRREAIDPKIKEHRGRIVNTTGDGLLSEFASVVDAVRCAVEVQREMAARNAGVQAERRIDFRIGINLGDVMIDENDIFGDGVNVAARLEALADPGGVCVIALNSIKLLELRAVTSLARLWSSRALRTRRARVRYRSNHPVPGEARRSESGAFLPLIGPSANAQNTPFQPFAGTTGTV
jgi:class 3 adenylate cyclase